MLQFWMQTLVTYGFGVDASWLEYVWMWKEVLIGVLWILGLIWVLRNWSWRTLLRNPWVVSIVSLVVALIVLTYLIHFEIVWWEMGSYLLAFKYDIFGFCILCVSLLGASVLTNDQRMWLINWYIWWVKIALLTAIAWYLVVFIKPWTLKIAWYDPLVFEGTVWQAPPAAYYTQINEWLPRNTFLFERPTTFGFWLIALWPLFYFVALRKEPLKYTWLWRAIYGLNIILTFSRAAWWAWIILLIAIPVLLSGKIKRSLFKYWLPAILIFALIAYIWFDTIIDRGYSNYGHMTMLNLWREMFTSSPLVGLGWATAWPGSHWNGIVFNPENQFLQVLIEFGTTWWGVWIWLFTLLCIRWLHRYMRESANWAVSYATTLLLAASLWMIWLAISGMVLHSFVDRMVVYPFMLLYGIAAISAIDALTNDHRSEVHPQESLPDAAP